MKSVRICRDTFFGMSANAEALDPASYASLDELAALLEVFGLPLAQELAKCAAKPLQVCVLGVSKLVMMTTRLFLHLQRCTCLRRPYEAVACERQDGALLASLGVVARASLPVLGGSDGPWR